MKLVFDIKPKNESELELYSWIEGRKNQPQPYYHGVFDNVGEILESVNIRKDELDRRYEWFDNEDRHVFSMTHLDKSVISVLEQMEGLYEALKSEETKAEVRGALAVIQNMWINHDPNMDLGETLMSVYDQYMTVGK